VTAGLCRNFLGWWLCAISASDAAGGWLQAGQLLLALVEERHHLEGSCNPGQTIVSVVLLSMPDRRPENFDFQGHDDGIGRGSIA
jgi:hypothetical protein